MKSFVAVLFFLGLIAVSLADMYNNNPYNNNNYRGRDQYSTGYMTYPRGYNNNYRPMNNYNNRYQPSYQMRPYNTYSSHSGPYNSYRAPSYPNA